MPKLSNVTDAEITKAISSTEDAIYAFQEMSDKIDKTYCDDIVDPLGKVSDLNHLIRAASQLQSRIILRHKMQEQKAEIERLESGADAA